MGEKDENPPKEQEARLPHWLKVRAPGGPNYLRVKSLLRKGGLHTVCEEAGCPNIGECFEAGTATFLILGDICTRNCRFCGVTKGRPDTLDEGEPERVAAAVVTLGLRYVVITSVTRDDLADGGAGIFAATIASVRRQSTSTKVEVLIPDLQGNWEALRHIVEAGPDVLNHNLETVRRLYPVARSKADYERSLELLERTKMMAPSLTTKSGLMAGLGEEPAELREVMADLRAVDCDFLTLGQYLRPGRRNLPVARFYTPAEFEELAVTARGLGFKHVESGPLVRSSYRAESQSRSE